MYFVQHIAPIDAFGKILPGIAFFAGTLDKIPDFKVKPVVIKFFTG
jgi:hypothetical protein